MPQPPNMPKMPNFNSGASGGSNPIMDVLSTLSQPNQNQQSITPGVSQIANPNNNFVTSALKGTNTVGTNPNTPSQPTVPISNTPATNSQNVGIFNNLQRQNSYNNAQ